MEAHSSGAARLPPPPRHRPLTSYGAGPRQYPAEWAAPPGFEPGLLSRSYPLARRRARIRRQESGPTVRLWRVRARLSELSRPRPYQPCGFLGVQAGAGGGPLKRRGESQRQRATIVPHMSISGQLFPIVIPYGASARATRATLDGLGARVGSLFHFDIAARVMPVCVASHAGSFPMLASTVCTFVPKFDMPFPFRCRVVDGFPQLLS